MKSNTFYASFILLFSIFFMIGCTNYQEKGFNLVNNFSDPLTGLKFQEIYENRLYNGNIIYDKEKDTITVSGFTYDQLHFDESKNKSNDQYMFKYAFKDIKNTVDNNSQISSYNLELKLGEDGRVVSKFQNNKFTVEAYYQEGIIQSDEIIPLVTKQIRKRLPNILKLKPMLADAKTMVGNRIKIGSHALKISDLPGYKSGDKYVGYYTDPDSDIEFTLDIFIDKTIKHTQLVMLSAYNDNDEGITNFNEIIMWLDFSDRHGWNVKGNPVSKATVRLVKNDRKEGSYIAEAFVVNEDELPAEDYVASPEVLDKLNSLIDDLYLGNKKS